jgi:hypothetical protein
VTRPAEYEKLLEIGSFKTALASKASIDQFMQNADELLTTAKGTASSVSKFSLAYDSMFNVVMAVLEFYEVRPGDAGGHRVTAIQRVAADLGLDSTKQSVLGRLHDSRNRVTYRQPIPPVNKTDADAMQKIADEMFSAATVLISGATSSED